MKKRLLALLLAVLVVSSFLTIGAAADNQKAMWVFKENLYITNNADGHAYQESAPYRRPFDAVAYSTNITAIAPFDCKVVKIDTSWNAGNAVGIESLAPVELANGDVEYITLVLCHDNDVSDLYVGQTLSQGEGFYQQGTYGQVTGAHIHMEVAKGQYSTSGLSSIFSFVRAQNRVMDPDDVFFLYSETNVVRTGGYSWKKVSSDPTPTKPDAPDANVVTVNYAAETISFDSSKYEVSANTGFTNMIANGGSISDFISSVSFSVYVRVKAQGSTPASDPTEVTIPGRSSLILAGGQVDYAKEEFNTSSDYQYSFDDSTWTNCNGPIPISVAAGHDTIYIRKAATSTSFASYSDELTVPTRPAAPTGLEATDETVDKRDDGSISGVTAAMQYRIQGGAWADCPEGTISGLADGSYEIRFKATNSALASEIAALTVNKGVPQTFTLSLSAPEFEAVTYNYAQPAAKPLTITSSGNTDSAISSVTSSSAAFVIGKGSETVPYGTSISDWTIQPAAGLEAGTYTATVTVAYNNGTTATDTVSIVVNKAPQAAPGKPELAKRDYTSIELKPLAPNANGAVAQYRIDGGEWQTSLVFKDLKAGTDYTFEQRYAAVGSYLASPASVSVKFSTESYNIKPTHEIKLEVSGSGEADTNLSNASELSNIIITATPDEGYTVGSVKVTGADGAVEVKRVSATEYRFIMPDGEVEVEVSFVREALPFADVARGSWYYDAVEYVYANGLMEGTSAAAFEPDANMTRAMVWAVLARIDGETISGAGWASDARAWAMESGVSDGTDPNGLITREQLVTMLYRFAGEPEHGGSLSAYADAKSVSSWAAGAMAWAVEEGVISGVTSTTLEPQSTATRAQCAAVLMRFDMR